MIHEEFQEMITAHALSALDYAEASVLEEHLATCLDCRTELDKWQSVASSLTFAAAEVEPSPQVRERILSQIKEQRVDAEGQQFNSDRATVLPFSTSRRNLWASIGSLGAIAAAVIFVALLVSVLVLWRENRTRQGEIARLQKEIQSAQQQRDRQREMLAMLTSPGTRIAELSGTNVARSASARIAYDKTGKAMLLASGLPAAPKGKAYQLWFIVGNQKLPGHVFTPDSAGNGDLKDQMPAEALAGSVFAVTLEPAAGVKSPTGDMFLVSGS
ncbi:MAG TPA: anti-sigma factor [Pyrinomonadaceae bacterium]